MRFRLSFSAFLLGIFFLWIFIPTAVFAQDIAATPGILPTNFAESTQMTPLLFDTDGISGPKTGDILVGSAQIFGTSSGAWALTFSYVDSPVETWFPLAQSTKPVSNTLLAIWDTRNVTDGVYFLRLRVFLPDIQQDFVVKVRVSNSVSSEVLTPKATLLAKPSPSLIPLRVSVTMTNLATGVAPNSLASETPVNLFTLTPSPSPVALVDGPSNPASLDPKAILFNLGSSILAVLLIFAVVGLMLFLRRK